MTAPRELRVLVVTSGWPTADRPENSVFVAQEVAALREAGVEVGVVTYDGRMDPLRYLRARRQVSRALSESTYDLLHAHFGQSGLVALGHGRPVVVTFHGSDLLGVVGRTGRYTMKGRLLQIISRAVAKRADRVIVTARRLVPRLPDGVTFDVIPAGVDPLVFSPGDKGAARTDLGLPRDRKFVLFSGSPHVARKRYDLALDSIARIQREFDVELLAVEGKTREDVARYMRASDALLVTAQHESGPLTVKEAVACGLPVVSVDVGDVAEVIGGLEGSVLCIDRSPETLAEGLRTVLAADARFDGRRRAAEFYQDALTARVLDVYASVTGQSAPSGR